MDRADVENTLLKNRRVTFPAVAKAIAEYLVAQISD
jgi:hypothetical protein